MQRERLTYFIIFSLVVAAAMIVGGQSSFAQLRIVGAISGNVQDPSGAMVPGARVILKDDVTGKVKETISSNEGTFFFPDLANGLYEITVTAPGFQSSVVNRISVSTSQTTDVKVKLAVGQQSESITVEGVTPVLETTSQLVTTTQTSKIIMELPINGGRSNALALARLIPGASPPAGGSTRYNNLPGGAVNVTVDGINDASNGFKSGGTVFYMTVPVRLGAVDEISVETGGLGADSGAQSGANIKFVTRRGGNKFHGSAFYEPTSERFNANSWLRNAQGLTRTPSRRHDFGGNFGGPLVPFGYFKDKMFFFVNFERSYAPLTIARNISVLTTEAQKGNFTYLVSGSTNQLRTINVLDLAKAQNATTKVDPVVQSILDVNNKIPQFAAKIPGTDFNRDTYTWNAENNDYAYFPTTRFDYYINPKQQFTFSWNYRHNWQAGERRMPVPDISRTNPFRLGYFVYSFALQSTLSPRMLNEFRYGVQHSGDSNASANYGSYFQYNGKPLRIGATLPFGPTVPFIDQQNVTGRHFITTMYDTFTMTRGQHNITMGLSYRKTDWKDIGEVFQVPSYSLGTPSGDPLPSSLFNQTTLPGIVNTDITNATSLYNTLTGRVSQANFTRVVNPDTLKYDGFLNYTWTRSNMGGLYIQDRWRIRPNLTLNYGLRWEVQGDMFDVKGITASPDIKSLFGPSTKLFASGTLSGNNDPTVEVGRQAFKPDYKNFAPNFGFAWNAARTEGWLGRFLGGQKTVLRGSYSMIVYDEGTQFFAQNLGTNAGKTIGASPVLIPGQSTLPAFTTLSDIVANPLTVSSFTFATTTYNSVIHQSDQTFARTISGMDPNLRAPYTLNWSLGFQRELMKNTVLEVRYVGNQAHKAWRTSNLNEVDIFGNKFLQEFKNAQSNLTINQAAGVSSFANRGLAGQSPLGIFDAAFGPRGSVAAIASGSAYTSSAFITNLQNGEAGALANTLATNQSYVCRMFGNSFSPCTRIDPNYNAAGAYPINFFLLNPYVAGRMNYVDNGGWNSYNGMQVQLRKRYSHGLDWTTNYTWAKSLTNLAADNANQGLDYTTRLNTGLDRRVSQFDIRHTLQTFGTYEMPVGLGRRWSLNNRLIDRVIGGWTVGSIMSFNTGQPVQLTGGFQTVNNTNNPASGGVILAPGVTLDQIQDMFGADRTRLVGRAGTTDLQRLAVDPKLVGTDGRANPAYLLPNKTPGEFGQFLFIRDKNTVVWNASLTKTFKIRESVRLQIFAGANNVLNHSSWGLGSANVFSTSFGVVGNPASNRSITLRSTLNF